MNLQTTSNSFFALDKDGYLEVRVRVLYALAACAAYFAFAMFPYRNITLVLVVAVGMSPILLLAFVLHTALARGIDAIVPMRLPYLRLLLPVAPLLLFYFYTRIAPMEVNEATVNGWIRYAYWARAVGLTLLIYSLAVAGTVQTLLPPEKGKNSGLLDDLDDEL